MLHCLEVSALPRYDRNVDQINVNCSNMAVLTEKQDDLEAKFTRLMLAHAPTAAPATPPAQSSPPPPGWGASLEDSLDGL